MKYALFSGCLIPTKLPQIESSTKAILKQLNVELVDSFNFLCCPNPVNVKQLDIDTWLSIGARNIALAEEKNVNIMSPCNGCANTLTEVNHTLKEGEKLKNKVNNILKEINKEYKGTIEVKHLIRVLYEDIGIEKIKREVKKKIPLKVATFYGCHLIKPSKVMNFDDAHSPKSLDDIVKAIGCESVNYLEKDVCCGSGLMGIEENAGIDMMREKLKHIKNSNADAIVVVCPACFSQFDLGQFNVARKYKERYEIPVFYLSQLIALAFGIEPKELGFALHKVKVEKVLEKVVSK